MHLIRRQEKETSVTSGPSVANGVDARTMTSSDAEAENKSTKSTARLIAELWLRHQPQVLERLNTLERAAASSGDASLTPQLLHEATVIAHKLAGSLGMFGFPEGTLLARQLEQDWESTQLDPMRLTGLTQNLRHAIFPEKIAPSSVPATPGSATLIA